MRFSVLGQFFGGFAVLDDFIFGLSVSNTPQCPPQPYIFSPKPKQPSPVEQQQQEQCFIYMYSRHYTFAKKIRITHNILGKRYVSKVELGGYMNLAVF